MVLKSWSKQAMFLLSWSLYSGQELFGYKKRKPTPAIREVCHDLQGHECNQWAWRAKSEMKKSLEIKQWPFLSPFFCFFCSSVVGVCVFSVLVHGNITLPSVDGLCLLLCLSYMWSNGGLTLTSCDLLVESLNSWLSWWARSTQGADSVPGPRAWCCSRGFVGW